MYMVGGKPPPCWKGARVVYRGYNLSHEDQAGMGGIGINFNLQGLHITFGARFSNHFDILETG